MVIHVGRLQNWCGDIDVFFFQLAKCVMHVYAIIETRPNFPYTQSMVAKRRPHKSGNVGEKSFKNHRGRIPIDTAFFAAIGKKNDNVRVWGDARRDQKPETSFLAWGYIQYLPSDSSIVTSIYCTILLYTVIVTSFVRVGTRQYIMIHRST